MRRTPQPSPFRAPTYSTSCRPSTATATGFRWHLPQGYAADDTTRYPVLYVLDGHYFFPAAYAAQLTLGTNEEIEKVIIVAIGDVEHEHPVVDLEPSVGLPHDREPVGRLRLRRTPSGCPGIACARAAATTSSGFSGYVQGSPLVERTFRASNDRGLSGWSFGGLFAGTVLLEYPGLFQRVGMSSPSLGWMNERAVPRGVGLCQGSTPRCPRASFSPSGRKRWTSVPRVARFADSLRSRGYAGLSVKHVAFDDESHWSVIPTTDGPDPARARPTAAPAPAAPPSVPVYVIMDITVHDRAAYARYRDTIAPVIAAHGGRYLVRSGAARFDADDDVGVPPAREGALGAGPAHRRRIPLACGLRGIRGLAGRPRPPPRSAPPRPRRGLVVVNGYTGGH